MLFNSGRRFTSSASTSGEPAVTQAAGSNYAIEQYPVTVIIFSVSKKGRRVLLTK